MRLLKITWAVCFLAFPCVCNAQSAAFPSGVPEVKPDMPLSEAMERAYTRYMSPTTLG